MFSSEKKYKIKDFTWDQCHDATCTTRVERDTNRSCAIFLGISMWKAVDQPIIWFYQYFLDLWRISKKKEYNGSTMGKT